VFWLQTCQAEVERGVSAAALRHLGRLVGACLDSLPGLRSDAARFTVLCVANRAVDINIWRRACCPLADTDDDDEVEDDDAVTAATAAEPSYATTATTTMTTTTTNRTTTTRTVQRKAAVRYATTTTTTTTTTITTNEENQRQRQSQGLRPRQHWNSDQAFCRQSV